MKIKFEFETILLTGLALAIVFAIYVLANWLNPDSVFCNYKIYRQPDGHYEVWWSYRSTHKEADCATYEEAKAKQRELCQGLIDFINRKPPGERVK